jgi:hypothetical protein
MARTRFTGARDAVNLSCTDMMGQPRQQSCHGRHAANHAQVLGSCY